jgi:hypothetical protein
MHVPRTRHTPLLGFGMPAAVLTQANALRWLGSAQYELAGLLLILNGQTRYGATLTIEQARHAPCVSAAPLAPPLAAPRGCPRDAGRRQHDLA